MGLGLYAPRSYSLQAKDGAVLAIVRERDERGVVAILVRGGGGRSHTVKLERHVRTGRCVAMGGKGRGGRDLWCHERQHVGGLVKGTHEVGATGQHEVRRCRDPAVVGARHRERDGERERRRTLVGGTQLKKVKVKPAVPHGKVHTRGLVQHLHRLAVDGQRLRPAGAHAAAVHDGLLLVGVDTQLGTVPPPVVMVERVRVRAIRERDHGCDGGIAGVAARCRDRRPRPVHDVGLLAHREGDGVHDTDVDELVVGHGEGALHQLTRAKAKPT